MLNREPMGMKRVRYNVRFNECVVSVLNREPMGMKLWNFFGFAALVSVSVLNREPMGMKRVIVGSWVIVGSCFSAQPRADGDEAQR